MFLVPKMRHKRPPRLAPFFVRELAATLKQNATVPADRRERNDDKGEAIEHACKVGASARARGNKKAAPRAGGLK